MTTRLPIPSELAAEVLFLSDRTCCVCRDPRRKTEIHHIDEDSANNHLDNLAVLCKDCHSDAHTTHAFARNLTAALLRRYNESWRQIVKLRVSPGGEEGDVLEYKLQVLLEFSLVPHQWKNLYIDRYPGQFRDTEAWTTDAWTYLTEHAVHSYSETEWQHYRPLFESVVPKIAERLETLVAAYGDAVPARIKLQVLRTTTALRTERLAYLYLPNLVKEVPENADAIFARRFQDTLLTLMALSQLADRERKQLHNVRNPMVSGQGEGPASAA